MIESAGNKLLVALLGSSVGVAMADTAAGVGGLLHILLPEPAAGAKSAGPPERYAVSGLPLFIEHMVRAGADKSRMRATISGGSISGPGDDLDLDFDTGSQITEIVLQILRSEKIQIIRSETNGYFGSRLSLETNTWQAEIQAIIPGSFKIAEAFKKPDSEDIGLAISRIRPIPQIALKIIRIIRDGNYNATDLSDEIQQDQVIGAKILRYCNSPLIGLRYKIDSIGRAILLLGEKRLLEVVVSASVNPFFDQREGGYSMMRGGLYQHSLGVAHIAKIIAALTGKTDPEAAYTAGLLHDIGKVILDQYITKFLPLFYQSIRSRDRNFVELEQEFIGINHQEAGRQLATRWNLPDNLTEAIALHHFPEEAVEDPNLVHIVYVADFLSSRFQAGLEFERMTSKGLADRLEQLGLSLPDIPEIIAKIPWEKMMYS